MPPEHLILAMLSTSTPRQPHWHQVGDQCAADWQRLARLLAGRGNGKFELSHHAVNASMICAFCSCLDTYRQCMFVELAMLCEHPAHQVLLYLLGKQLSALSIEQHVDSEATTAQHLHCSYISVYH